MTCVDPYMREALAGHVLEQVLDTETFKAFYLKRPGQGRMMSCLIVFTPEGIVLQGDLTPEHNGSVSCLGYGIGWFSQRLSEGYLCSKFLQEKFVPEFAIAGLKRAILEQRYERELEKCKARELWDSMRWFEDPVSPERVYEFWTQDLMNADSEGCPGYGYKPGEAGWLCAIQQRFAELAASLPEEVQP